MGSNSTTWTGFRSARSGTWCVANAANGWAADGIVFSDSDDYAVEAEAAFRFVGHKDAALF